MGLVGQLARADEELYMKVSKIDGLPARLIESRALTKEIASSKEPIDLAPAFREIGLNIPQGGAIFYDHGVLLRNLDRSNHDLVDSFVEHLYRNDNQIAACRAYYNLLELLSPEDRFRTAMRIGFLPDPLVASTLDEIRSLRAEKAVSIDPFAQLSPPKPKQLTDEENARLKRLEKTASALLEISIRRLKEQLSAIDVEGVGAKQ